MPGRITGIDISNSTSIIHLLYDREGNAIYSFSSVGYDILYFFYV